MDEAEEADDQKDAPTDAATTGRWLSVGRLPLAAGLLAVVIVAVVVTVVVTDDSGPDGPDDPAAEEWRMDARDVADVERALPGWGAIVDDDVEPLALSDEPVWGQERGSPWVLRDAWLQDDAAILYGGYVDDPGSRLQVVDAATGEPRWGLSRGHQLHDGDDVEWSGQQPPAVVDLGDDTWTVLVEYRCIDHCLEWPDVEATLSEHGVAALSPDDGRVLWTSPIAANDTFEPGAGPLVDPVALVAGDGAAVMATEPRCHDTGQVHAGLKTVALDPVGGRRLWEVDGLIPLAVTGDTVLTRPESPSEEHECTQPNQRDVVALDAATGAVQWDLRERFGWSDLILTAGDVALVKAGASGDSEHEILVLDLTDGSEVASFGTGSDDCASDGRTLIACTVGVPGHDGGLATFDVDERRGGVAVRNEAYSSVDSVGLGRVFAGGGIGVSGPAPSGQIASFDRSAHVVDRDLPGSLLAASDEYAMFVCPTSDCAERRYHGGEDDAAYPRYVVHRLGG